MTFVPQDLLDRVAALEREVRQLRGRAQLRPALNQILNGTVLIGEGGELIAQAPAGGVVFRTGQTPEGDWSVSVGREDGTLALSVGTDAESSGQMIRTHSRDGHILMMDDAYADGYLGRPFVPVPMLPPATLDGTDTAVYSGYLVVQHKVLFVNATLYAAAGTTARIRLLIGNSEVGSWTVSSAGTAQDVNARIPLPASQFAHGEGAPVVLWGQRTAGTGACSVRLRGIWGLHTATAEEAN